MQLPVQQLIVAETALSHNRHSLACLSYSLYWFGALISCLSALILDLKSLCILNVVLSVTHFVSVAFLHPETPRFYMAVKDDKRQCVEAMQWLRGKASDISQEYEELSDNLILHKSKPTSFKSVVNYYDRLV